MYLTEEQKTIGRRNFLMAVAGVPALVALGNAAPRPQAVRGGPVKIAMIGTGGMGRELLTRYQKELSDLRAVCDVNPSRRLRGARPLPCAPSGLGRRRASS